LRPLLDQALAHPSLARTPVCFGQDDTLVRKTGKQTFGVSYARAPLGPHFQVNLVLGWRFVQTSLLLRPGQADHPWRALEYKEVVDVCWPKATRDRPLRLIVIKPAGYRLRQGSKLLYREPGLVNLHQP
jgi:hypothetical protein